MSTLAITRKTSGTIITASGFNTNYDEVEAVVNALTADNLAADSVSAVKLNSDVVRADYGLKQHTDGSLQVDVSDTNPSLELSDGGLRAKVYGVINRTSDGLTWGRTGDVIFSSSASTPDGFSDVSATYEGKMLRISATALSSGGSDTHTHGAGSYAGPSHSHGSVTGGVSFGSGTGSLTAGALDTTHNHSISADGTGAVTGTSASGSNVPAYITLKVFSKN